MNTKPLNWKQIRACPDLSSRNANRLTFLFISWRASETDLISTESKIHTVKMPKQINKTKILQTAIIEICQSDIAYDKQNQPKPTISTINMDTDGLRFNETHSIFGVPDYLWWILRLEIKCQMLIILCASNSSIFRQANREIQYNICKNKSSVNSWWIFLEWLRFVFIDFYSNKMRKWDVIKSMRSHRAHFHICCLFLFTVECSGSNEASQIHLYRTLSHHSIFMNNLIQNST